MTWSHLLVALAVWVVVALALAPIVGSAIGRSARTHPLAARPRRAVSARDHHLVGSRAA